MNIQCSFCETKTKAKGYKDLPLQGWRHIARTTGGVMCRLVGCPEHCSEFQLLGESFMYRWRSKPEGWDLNYDGTVARCRRFGGAGVSEKRQLTCCMGIGAQGEELIAVVTVPDDWVGYYCKKCGNPLGIALPPEVEIDSIRWVTKKRVIPWVPVFRQYPRSTLCGRCISIVEVDWRESESIQKTVDKGGDRGESHYPFQKRL